MMFLYLLLVISQIASAAGYCYSRNGTTLLNAAFQPCNNTTKYSACCMTNHSGAGDVGIADDVCMENGLCQNYAAFDGNNEGEQVWSRQGCTDPLWNSPYCLGDVCNKPEVFCPLLRVRMSLIRHYSTPTNGAMWAFTTAEGKPGAVERRPVVIIRAVFSKSQQPWVRHRLFPQRCPFRH